MRQLPFLAHRLHIQHTTRNGPVLRELAPPVPVNPGAARIGEAAHLVVNRVDLPLVAVVSLVGGPHERREPLVLPTGAGVTDALYRMQRLGATMAVVEDADGRHVGIVTIKDLVEEIVGELEAW